MARDNDRDADKSDRELLLELAGRARRTETRVTTLVNASGLEAGETKPTVDHHERVIWVKTPRTSLEDIIAAIGEDAGSYVVRCGETTLLFVTAP